MDEEALTDLGEHIASSLGQEVLEVNVTFGELTRVKVALVDALLGYYHTRIPYPGFPGREEGAARA